MIAKPEVFSVVPKGLVHRVIGERVVIPPGLNLEILTTRKIVLETWELNGLSDPYWRLYLPVKGSAVVEIGGKQCELTPGNAFGVRIA